VLISLFTAEQDMANIEVSRLEAQAQTWENIAQQRRQQAAAQARKDAEDAKQLAPEMPQELKNQFDINIRLGQSLEQVTKDEAKSAEKLNQRQSALKALEEEFAQTRQRLQTAHLSETMGLFLRQRRRELPGSQIYRRDSARRQLIIRQLGEAQFDLNEKRRNLIDTQAEVDRILQPLSLVSEDSLAQWEKKVRTLIADRRDLLENLQSAHRRYLNNLQSIEFTEQRLTALTVEYADFLDGNLLWIRSSGVFGLPQLRNIPAASLWLINPLNWVKLLENLADSLSRSPVMWILGLLIGSALLAVRPWAGRLLTQLAKSVGRVKKDSLMVTVRALGLTICLAAGLPFWLFLLGWGLQDLPSATEFSSSVAAGLLSAGLAWLTFGFLHDLCDDRGVAQVHFKWPEASIAALHRHLTWFAPLWVVALFITDTVEASNQSQNADSLGRLSLIAAMIALVIFTAKMLRVVARITTTSPDNAKASWLIRLRYLWYIIAIALPAALAILAIIGYYYTAWQLTLHVYETALLVLALVIGNSLALRWLLISQRRLAYEEAVRKRREKLEAGQAPQSGQPAAGSSAETLSIEVEEPEISRAAIDEQTRSMIRTLLLFASVIGLWVIWDEVLPALNVLENVHLWSYEVEVEGVTRVMPITLTSVMFAVVVAAIALVAARNLPGVLEISVLRYLSLDSGARYAVTTICRYVITTIGIVVAFNFVGINWSSLKWLVAALGVGIGFGLQEIIANFISGLIILFERPIRVGDIVTVENVDGVVSRIQIRATTITTWDRKEYIVPNKEFITGRVLNWTLSNAINRIVITVGVAYGSDTEKAREMMLKVAQDHPLILEDPAPVATFEGFGDNCLNLLLRSYLPDLDNRLKTVTDLHAAIDKAFREAGITIAFPQRDVHLDHTGPVEVRVMPEQIKPSVAVPTD
jgi:potassium efflux system protein